MYNSSSNNDNNTSNFRSACVSLNGSANEKYGGRTSPASYINNSNPHQQWVLHQTNSLSTSGSSSNSSGNGNNNNNNSGKITKAGISPTSTTSIAPSTDILINNNINNNSSILHRIATTIKKNTRAISPQHLNSSAINLGAPSLCSSPTVTASNITATNMMNVN